MTAVDCVIAEMVGRCELLVALAVVAEELAEGEVGYVK